MQPAVGQVDLSTEFDELRSGPIDLFLFYTASTDCVERFEHQENVSLDHHQIIEGREHGHDLALRIDLLVEKIEKHALSFSSGRSGESG